MCIYSSLCGLDAPVDGGKCRGVITYYYSRPSSSLLRSCTSDFFVNSQKKKKNLILVFSKVFMISLTAKSISDKSS